MIKTYLTQPVIYQISDGKGGMEYHAAIVVKILPDTDAVNLHVFAQDAGYRDMTHHGVPPVDPTSDIPVEQQSNRWRVLEAV